jgi:hypothetical protein
MSDGPESKPEASPNVVKGRWAKGQSGNPGGRPKGLARAIRESLGDTDGTGGSLRERMIRIWNGDEKGFGARERMEAGKWLSDRGYGRVPETQIQLQGELGEQGEAVTAMADDALSELLSAIGPSEPDPDPSGGSDGGTPDAKPRAA